MNRIQKDELKILITGSLTEFGERYSYYIIQGLLIFFLIERFKISQAESSTLIGTVLSVIYISAIVGGYIADKLLGHYVSAFFGSILMVLGSIILTLSTSQNGLYFGLAFISISTGLIKSNISSFIGNFYNKAKLSEGRRDFGFSVFYVGINLGSFFALFCASYFKEHYGFAAPFYSSIFMTTLMLINLCIGFFKLKDYIVIKNYDLRVLGKSYAAIIVYILFVYAVLQSTIIAQIAIFVAVFLCLLILFKSVQAKYLKNVAVASVFFLLSILYWALYFQIFIVLLVFIERTVEHKFFIFNMGSSQFLSIESLSVLIFGGIMGKIWLYFSNKNKPIHDIDKFNTAFFILIVSYGLIYCGIQVGEPQVKVMPLVFFISYVTLAISELSLSAIGLSFVTKIAPPGFVSLYMGVWLVTLGLGGKLAGLLAENIDIPAANTLLAKANMAQGLLEFIVLGIAGCIICFLVRKRIINTVITNR